MLYCFKVGKQKLAYDTASGAVVSLTSLEYKMLQAITPPLPPVCPSSLRYELAKYDSTDVEEAYDALYSLIRQNLLFAAGDEVCLRIGGTYGMPTDSAVALEIAKLLTGNTPRFIIDENIDAEKTDVLCALF